MSQTCRLLLESPCLCWRNIGLLASTVHTQAHTATCWLPAATVDCHRVHTRKVRPLLPWDTQSCMLNFTLGSWACLLPLRCSMKMNLFAHFLEETLSLSPGFWEFLLAMNSSLYAKYLPSPPPPHFICSWAPLWSSSSFMVMVSSHLLTPTQTTYTDTQSKFLGLSTSWFSLSLPSTHSLGCGHHSQDCAILQGVDSSFPGNKAQGEQLGA